jgi:hypothetical protein
LLGYIGFGRWCVGIRYLQQTQEDDGSWYAAGRELHLWNVAGLARSRIGEDMTRTGSCAGAIGWKLQNDDAAGGIVRLLRNSDLKAKARARFANRLGIDGIVRLAILIAERAARLRYLLDTQRTDGAGN